MKTWMLLVVWVSIVIACVTGWVMNIVKLWDISDQAITGEFAIRVVGVFVVPLGIVVGYL